MKVKRIAQLPPTVPMAAMVKDAIPSMGAAQGCAVAVVDGKLLVGTLSKDDVMLRVVAAGRNLETTTVGEVMTSPVETVSTETDTEEALKLMFARHQCYLPVVDRKGKFAGWISICHLFHHHVDDLVHQLNSLEAYIGANGPGG